MQFNLQTKRMEEILYLQNISEGVFPIMWTESVRGFFLSIIRFATLIFVLEFTTTRGVLTKHKKSLHFDLYALHAKVLVDLYWFGCYDKLFGVGSLCRKAMVFF